MPMTEAMDDFCVEVRRIVECPYTPSLKVSGICEWIRPRGVVCACNVYFIFENFIAITKVHDSLQIETELTSIFLRRSFMNFSEIQISTSCTVGPEAMRARLSA